MTIKLVRQNTPTTCGQACIAMVRGLTLQVAVEMFGHAKITSDEQILTQLRNDTLKFVSGKPPDNVLAIQKHRNPKDSSQEHWTVSDHGVTLDPAQIQRKLWPVIKHVVISTEILE